MATGLLQTADLHFRSYLHTVMPLHDSLVEEMCDQAEPPLELATVLEDIGQRYMALAQMLNEALIRKGLLAREPEADDAMEARLEAYVQNLITDAGAVRFRDGSSVEGSRALRNFPFVAGAMHAALLLARSGLDGREARDGGSSPPFTDRPSTARGRRAGPRLDTA